jgi:excisionase family DNA binding protein
MKTVNQTITTHESVVVSIREAAQILGRSEPAIRHLVARGQIESVQLGSRRFITREALNTYLRGTIVR